MNKIYEIEYLNKIGEIETLKKYQNKVIIIVNTASKCGFANQFEELEKINKEYKEVVVLGFPSNDFKQEVKENIEKVCKLNHGVTFDLMKTSHVRGKDEIELFKYLTNQKRGLLTRGIKWNFTKFLIDKNGNVVNRYAPKTKPSKMRVDIEKLLI